MLQRKERPARPVSIDLGARWFVARTNPRCEEKAFSGLLREGFKAHLPRGLKYVRRRHMKSRQSVVFPILTGYLFVGLSRDTPDFYEMREVDGIASILGRQFENDTRNPLDRYIQVRPTIVQEFHQLEEEGAFDMVDVEGRPFEPGDAVTIKAGPIKGMKFTFDDYFGKNTAHVIGNLFGSVRPISIELAHLTKAS